MASCLEEAQLVWCVTHHGIIDFSKTLFRYLEPPSVSPKHPILGKENSQKPIKEYSQVNDRANITLERYVDYLWLGSSVGLPYLPIQ